MRRFERDFRNKALRRPIELEMLYESEDLDLFAIAEKTMDKMAGRKKPYLKIERNQFNKIYMEVSGYVYDRSIHSPLMHKGAKIKDVLITQKVATFIYDFFDNYMADFIGGIYEIEFLKDRIVLTNSSTNVWKYGKTEVSQKFEIFKTFF